MVRVCSGLPEYQAQPTRSLDIDELVGDRRTRDASRIELPVERNAAAVVRLQSFFSAAHARRRRVSTSPLAHLRQRAFERCLDGINECPPTTASARCIILGVFPHALACISALKFAFEVAKDTYSRELRQVDHAGLEEAGAKVVEIE